MAFSVVMPALELAQETGKLLAWRKKEGESVAKGEPLLEVETDKVVVEVEAPADGILAGVRAQAGDSVPVGRVIAWIVGPGEVPPADVPQASAPSPRMSPRARRLAKEHGVDAGVLRGSGPGGEILASDILAVAQSRGASEPEDVEALGPVARLMAERTTQSWTMVPHFFVVREVDAGALVEIVKKAQERQLTYTDLLVALVARVLGGHPRMNASWTEKGIRLNQAIHIGVAVAVRDGVVAAVIHNAGAKALGEITTERRDLTERARAGRLRPADVTGATFTISNLGMYQVDAFSAIINPPQAAILAVGSITDRVVPVDGRPGIRPMMTLTLSCDHRVVDGARAAAFMNDVVEAIGAPERLLK